MHERGEINNHFFTLVNRVTLAFGDENFSDIVWCILLSLFCLSYTFYSFVHHYSVNNSFYFLLFFLSFTFIFNVCFCFCFFFKTPFHFFLFVYFSYQLFLDFLLSFLLSYFLSVVCVLLFFVTFSLLPYFHLNTFYFSPFLLTHFDVWLFALLSCLYFFT